MFVCLCVCVCVFVCVCVCVCVCVDGCVGVSIVYESGNWHDFLISLVLISTADFLGVDL